MTLKFKKKISKHLNKLKKKRNYRKKSDDDDDYVRLNIINIAAMRSILSN